MSQGKELNIALIGHRFMGKAHTHAYTDVPIFFEPKLRPVKKVLCAVGDDVADVAHNWGWQEWDTDWKKVVSRPDIDAVDICAPSILHKEITLAAVREGKHVFCEKPLAMNLSDAKEMYEEVQKAGIVHTIGFNYRKVPALALGRQLIKEGRIGRIFHFRGIYSQDWLVNPDFPLAWRLRKKDAGAGSSWDLGAHVVDIARYLIGGIDEVVGHQTTFVKERPVAAFEDGLTAIAGKKKGTVDVDDTTSFLARFENDTIGIFEVTRYGTGHRNQNRIEVNGGNGGFVFSMERMNELDFYSSEDPEHVQGYKTIQVGESSHPYMAGWWPAGHIIGFGDTFVHEILDFVNAIADKKEASPSFHDGYICQAVLAAVDRSIAERRWVKISDML